MTTTRNILLLLLAFNILGGAGLWYGYNEVHSAKLKETTLREELVEERGKSNQIDQAERVLLATKVDREELAQYLYSTSDEDQIKFISMIEQMGTSTSGAVIETKTLELTKAKPPTLRATFTVKGTWQQVFHILRLIEESPSRISINRFDVRDTKGGDWSGDLHLELLSLKEAK